MKKPMLRKFRLAKAMEVLDAEDVRSINAMEIIDVFKSIVPYLEFRELSAFHTSGRAVNAMHDDMGDLIEHIAELTESIVKGSGGNARSYAAKECEYFTWTTAPQNKLGLISRNDLAKRLDEELSHLIRACMVSKVAENNLTRRLHPIAHDLTVVAKGCIADNQ